MVIDGKMAYLGSANITTTSFSFNLEVGAKVYNEARELKKLFESLWQVSRPVNLD
jgi:phosphatidylserine/phosphatidylglycerophosphate/cardiolipin synthase-like enzyme